MLLFRNCLSNICFAHCYDCHAEVQPLQYKYGSNGFYVDIFCWNGTTGLRFISQLENKATDFVQCTDSDIEKLCQEPEIRFIEILEGHFPLK